MVYSFSQPVIYMDFAKYLANLENQLKMVNSDIMEKEEELNKLKEFRSQVKGGIEVVKQIESDNSEEPQPLQLQQEIRKTVEEMVTE